MSDYSRIRSTVHSTKLWYSVLQVKRILNFESNEFESRHIYVTCFTHPSQAEAMTEPSNDAVHSDALYNHMPRLSVVAFTDSLAACSANLEGSHREIQNRCHNSDGGELSRKAIICPI